MDPDSERIETFLSVGLFLGVDADEFSSVIAKRRRWIAAFASADGLAADRIDSGKVAHPAGVVQW